VIWPCQPVLKWPCPCQPVVDVVGDRRKSSGSRTMTSDKMSERMTAGLMSGKISGVEAVSRSKNST
jgi:hypothetical protein